MKSVIRTERAPAALGPYSQAVRAGPWLFCSGQIALDPATGKLIGSDAASQMRQVLQNLAEVLSAAGLGFSDVVRTVIYLTDLKQFDKVNAVYAERFPSDPPARATVEVSGLPRGALVELEAVAYKGQ
jgi:2-iminobutanoate/2-iminopropanoate deaminase